MTDDTFFEAMAQELHGKRHDMDVCIQAVTVLQLAGMLQLACRHPDLPNSNRACAESFIAAARQYFADCPAVLDCLKRGEVTALPEAMRRAIDRALDEDEEDAP